MNNNKVITKSQFAREIKISRTSVYTLIEKHIIPVRKDGKIDLSIALKKWEEYREHQVGISDKKSSEYNFHRTRREKLNADILELDLAEKKGKLVRIEDVLTAEKNIASIVRTKLLSIPSKVAPLVAPEKSVKKIKSTLDEVIREVLHELVRLKNGS
jgi:phage terminase Nu1 subunit (DNA packaging protein)